MVGLPLSWGNDHHSPTDHWEVVCHVTVNVSIRTITLLHTYVPYIVISYIVDPINLLSFRRHWYFKRLTWVKQLTKPSEHFFYCLNPVGLYSSSEVRRLILLRIKSSTFGITWFLVRVPGHHSYCHLYFQGLTCRRCTEGTVSILSIFFSLIPLFTLSSSYTYTLNLGSKRT